MPLTLEHFRREGLLLVYRRAFTAAVLRHVQQRNDKSFVAMVAASNQLTRVERGEFPGG